MKRMFSLLAALVVVFSLGSGRVRAAEEAAQITARVADGAGNRLAALEDANRNSKLQLTGDPLTVTGDARFYGIYLIWDQPPGNRSATADGRGTPSAPASTLTRTWQSSPSSRALSHIYEASSSSMPAARSCCCRV